MADDDVQLTDLEVIQRYSLAVRGATASRADLVAALQADLAWLQGGRRTAAAKTAGNAARGKAAAPQKADVLVEGEAPVEAEAPVAGEAPVEEATPVKAAERAKPAKKAPAKTVGSKRKA